MTTKITVLVDNNTLIDSYFCGEPGVCYYIETDDIETDDIKTNNKKILFDTGYSNIFIDNANILGIDLAGVTDLVLSHGHNDHTWGLSHLVQHFDRRNIEFTAKKRLIAHPHALLPKTYNSKVIGANLPKNLLDTYFDCVDTAIPYYITDKVIFLGQIPRDNAFEGKEPIGQTLDADGQMIDDYVLDDSALVIKTSDGIIIITGCSHAGICNIVEYAKKVTQMDKIITVIGGFHLQEASEQILNQTGEYLHQLNISHIHPCHCTDLAAKIHLSKYAAIKEVGVGLQLIYPD